MSLTLTEAFRHPHNFHFAFTNSQAPAEVCITHEIFGQRKLTLFLSRQAITKHKTKGRQIRHSSMV